MEKHNINLKELWKKQSVSTPDIKEIQAKVSAYKKDNFRKMIMAYSSQIIPVIACIVVLYLVESLPWSTKFGMILMLAGILYFLMKYNSFYTLVKQLDATTSNKEYLQSLIGIKEKERELQTRTLSIFYMVLIVALHFYMYNQLSMMSLPIAIAVYAVTASWIAFAWFYLRPRTIKKNEAKINELIGHYSTILSPPTKN